MANNHEQFISFNNTIKLSKTKRETLMNNRKSLRDAIKKYFDNNKPDEIKPKFHSQGSYIMKTIVNPIATKSEDGERELLEYDIDDGVYFIGDEETEDRKSVSTYHNWIYDAVKGHTERGAEKRTTCVRVLYADGHNIDLPIYYILNEDNSIPELAHKLKGWINSDPREFYEWFNDKAKKHHQLRRIVRYLKAWSDYRHSKDSTNKLPSGFILTILAAENIFHDERDDKSLYETLINIRKKINEDYGGKFECKRPTVPTGEDLFSNFSDTRREYFLSQLDKFITSAQQAVSGKNPKESCLKWQKHLGDRFSCATAIDEDEQDAKTHQNPAIIRSNAKSALFYANT